MGVNTGAADGWSWMRGRSAHRLGDTEGMHRLPLLELVAVASALVDIARKKKPKPDKPKKPPRKRKPKAGEQWLDLLWL